jgi:hypothetical protein
MDTYESYGIRQSLRDERVWEVVRYLEGLGGEVLSEDVVASYGPSDPEDRRGTGWAAAGRHADGLAWGGRLRVTS